MDTKISVAICPPGYFVDKVDIMKQSLSKALGTWFRSKNAKAHITFNTASLQDHELQQLESFLEKFCSHYAPFEIGFDRTGSYPNGAFFLGPDAASRISLISLMKSFHDALDVRSDSKSLDPHMSIARQLSADQLNVAASLFDPRDITLSFLCSGLTIRMFDPAKRQYFIYREFPFAGKNIAGKEQMSLF